MAKTRTKADLAAEVAKNMNLLRPGEELSARTRASLDRQYDHSYSELVDREVAYWPPDQIPAAVFSRLAWFVAIEVAPSFGMLPIVLKAINQPDAQSARNYYIGELREHVSKGPRFETPTPEFF